MMEAHPTSEIESTTNRRLACARCGTEFACNLNGDCWCMAEDVRLPLPAVDGGDCLCRDCLRKAAEEA